MIRAATMTFGLVLIAAQAVAQTTTDCQRTAIGVTCDTSPSPAAGFAALANALAARRQKQAAITQIQRDIQAGNCDDAKAVALRYGDAGDVAWVAANCVPVSQRQQQAEQSLMANVSTAVREGRCDDAKAIALGANRLDVADQAMRLCAPKGDVK